MNTPHTHSGFTLVELMITVSVAAILLSVAAPSFRDTVVRNRLTAATNEFMAAINYTRSEAIKSGRSVTLCKSSSGTACTTGTGSQWESGWIAFVDSDADGTLDSGETLLRAWPAFPTGYTLRTNSTNFTNFLRYNALGAVANNSVGGTFVTCYNNQTTDAKSITITQLRPRLGVDTNGNRIPEKDNDGASVDISSCTSP
jgi:type IV fimbrial biogenesis protein FimT